MKFDARFWQRAFLAFSTGLFLSCAARVAQDGSPLPTISSFSAAP